MTRRNPSRPLRVKFRSSKFLFWKQVGPVAGAHFLQRPVDRLHCTSKWPCDGWLWALVALWVRCQQEVPIALPIGAENKRFSPTLVSASLSNTHRDSATRCFTQAGSAAHIPFPTAAGPEQGFNCLIEPGVWVFLEQAKLFHERLPAVYVFCLLSKSTRCGRSQSK